MTLRFSLRVFLFFVGVVCSACYWRCQPRHIANEFGQLVTSARFAEADAMLIDDGWNIRGYATSPHRRVDVQPLQQSLSQWLRGICPIALTLHDSSTDWLPLRPGSRHSNSQVLLLLASAGGVKVATVADSPTTAQKVADRFF